MEKKEWLVINGSKKDQGHVEYIPLDTISEIYASDGCLIVLFKQAEDCRMLDPDTYLTLA